jgi:hypothetical protein
MRLHMLDRCPVSPLADVRATVAEDLGAPPEQLFASFSPQPIASASLAQVHEAVDHDGQRLAVKVGPRGCPGRGRPGASWGGSGALSGWRRMQTSMLLEPWAYRPLVNLTSA